MDTRCALTCSNLTGELIIEADTDGEEVLSAFNVAFPLPCSTKQTMIPFDRALFPRPPHWHLPGTLTDRRITFWIPSPNDSIIGGGVNGGL
jgi:hypothetical protein